MKKIIISLLILEFLVIISYILCIVLIDYSQTKTYILEFLTNLFGILTSLLVVFFTVQGYNNSINKQLEKQKEQYENEKTIKYKPMVNLMSQDYLSLKNVKYLESLESSLDLIFSNSDVYNIILDPINKDEEKADIYSNYYDTLHLVPIKNITYSNNNIAEEIDPELNTTTKYYSYGILLLFENKSNNPIQILSDVAPVEKKYKRNKFIYDRAPIDVLGPLESKKVFINITSVGKNLSFTDSIKFKMVLKNINDEIYEYIFLLRINLNFVDLKNAFYFKSTDNLEFKPFLLVNSIISNKKVRKSTHN